MRDAHNESVMKLCTAGLSYQSLKMTVRPTRLKQSMQIKSVRHHSTHQVHDCQQIQACVGAMGMTNAAWCSRTATGESRPYNGDQLGYAYHCSSDLRCCDSREASSVYLLPFNSVHPAYSVVHHLIHQDSVKHCKCCRKFCMG